MDKLFSSSVTCRRANKIYPNEIAIKNDNQKSYVDNKHYNRMLAYQHPNSSSKVAAYQPVVDIIKFIPNFSEISLSTNARS